MKKAKEGVKDKEKTLRVCTYCAYCIKHPFIADRSICLNEDSAHYGSLIDMNDLNRRWRTDICYIAPLILDYFFYTEVNSFAHR